MTKLKDQPWYENWMDKKFPKKRDRDMKGLKFIPGRIYFSHNGNHKTYYECVKRSESGFIFFRRIYMVFPPDSSMRYDEIFRRKPEKGWDRADERVTIDKGHCSHMVRGGCWMGGETLYARNQYTNKKRTLRGSQKGYYYP